MPPGALTPQGIEGAMKRDVSKHWCTLQWCASRGWYIAHENWTSCRSVRLKYRLTIKIKYIPKAYVFLVIYCWISKLWEDSQIFSQVSVLAPTLTMFTASSVLPLTKLVLYFSETYLQLSHDYNCNLVIYVHYQCQLVKNKWHLHSTQFWIQLTWVQGANGPFWQFCIFGRHRNDSLGWRTACECFHWVEDLATWWTKSLWDNFGVGITYSLWTLLW